MRRESSDHVRREHAAAGRPRLLVVDDSEPVRELVSELASEAGFAVVGAARDGSAGVMAAVQLEPDVVVMDYRMPELDGVQATRAILERRPEIEVIAFSSADEELVADAFAAAGASAYVSKTDVDGLVEELSRRRPAAGR